MSVTVATLAYSAVIAVLLWLGRDSKEKTSLALWIPLTWFSLACSRTAGQWLSMGTGLDSPDQYLEGSPFDRDIYTTLLILGLGVLLARGNKIGRLLRANAAILAFYAYCAVSISWSDYPDVSLKRWTKLLGDLVMILVVLSDREPLTAIKRFLGRPAFLLIPLSILLIKYYPGIGTIYSPFGGAAYYGGVTTNKNTLGVICMGFGLASVWRILVLYQDKDNGGRRRKVAAHAVILAMIFWLFYTANSMTSFSCFMMATVLLLGANLRTVIRRPALVHILIAAMLAFSASVVFLGASPDTLKAMGRNPTLTDRTEVWGWLFSLVRNPLIGTGYESFWLGPRLEKMWSIYWWHPNEAHNGYIETYINLGWLGVTLLAVVLVAGYRAVIAAYRRNRQLGSLCLAYFLVGLAYNFTEAAFFKIMAPAWLFFLFANIGAAAILCGKVRPAPQKLSQPASASPTAEPQIGLTEELV